MSQLIEQKETDRQVKGYEIYKQGLVTQISESKFEVQGSQGTYIVEDLDKTLLNYDGYTCECKDYLYNKQGFNCKHIIAVTFLQLRL